MHNVMGAALMRSRLATLLERDPEFVTLRSRNGTEYTIHHCTTAAKLGQALWCLTEIKGDLDVCRLRGASFEDCLRLAVDKYGADPAEAEFIDDD